MCQGVLPGASGLPAQHPHPLQAQPKVAEQPGCSREGPGPGLEMDGTAQAASGGHYGGKWAEGPTGHPAAWGWGDQASLPAVRGAPEGDGRSVLAVAVA